jgi:putative DNA primase/helicase
VIDLSAAGISANPYGAAEQRVPCPHCAKGRRDRALGVNIENGVFHCFRCDWSGRAAGEEREPLVWIDDAGVAERKRERLRQTWRESLALTHPKAYAVRAYLEARALGPVLEKPPKVLRAHPGLPYWDGARDLGRYPAMVALFHGATGQAVTLHVTYLRRDGCAKASVPSPKKILGVPVKGATRGGAIHLYEAHGGRLGIAEGIESALSLHLLHGLPVWAAFCADNLARVHLPRYLPELYIGMDMDASGTGERVARALATRVRKWSRTEVWYVKPELDGPGDLNDELRRRANDEHT